MAFSRSSNAFFLVVMSSLIMNFVILCMAFQIGQKRCRGRGFDANLPVTELFDFSESEEYRVVLSYPLESGTTGNVEQLSYRIRFFTRCYLIKRGATTLCLCLEPVP